MKTVSHEKHPRAVVAELHHPLLPVAQLSSLQAASPSLTNWFMSAIAPDGGSVTPLCLSPYTKPKFCSILSALLQGLVHGDVPQEPLKHIHGDTFVFVPIP